MADIKTNTTNILNPEKEKLYRMNNAQKMAGFNLKATDIIILLCLTGALIALLIYAITLLYNGFKIATNVKQTSHKVFFGIAILVAEILCKIILSILLNL
jgi:hypothetical protein